MPEIEQTLKKLAEFTRLERGWHFGEGGPIHEEEVVRAAKFLNTAEELGIETANAFPLVSGEIELTFYRGDRTIAFVLESHGKFSITEEDECEIISDVYGQPYSVAEEILKGISHVREL
jgi:hypothetical protein